MNDKLHFLYAEDNALDADLTREHFAREAPDIRLEIVETGARCLSRLAEESFDLLLLDNHLPDMDGLDVLAQLRADGRTLPVVMVSGQGDEDVVVRTQRAGAVDYVSKSDSNYLATLHGLLRLRVQRHRQHMVGGDGEKRVWQILYVEPNPMDVELTALHIAAEAPHLQMHVVSSSREALALLRSGHHFDLVLTDLRVPDMSAEELMHEAQRSDIELPFIVITGKGDEASAVAILRLGAYDYIVKRDNYLTHLPHAIDHALQRLHLDQTTLRLNAELATLNASLEQKIKERTLELMNEIKVRQQAETDLSIAAVSFESQESIMITDAASIILRVNKAFTETTGFSAEEAIGKTPRLLKSGYHNEAFYREMWETLHRTGVWQGEIWDRRKNGEAYPKWLVITAVKGANGVITHYVGSHVDITERKAAEEKIQLLAFYDPLTGLPNRRLLQDRLSQSLATCLRMGSIVALLFIDLDNFKNLNDTFGHQAGDQLLLQVAQRLTACVRAGDTVARIGGDEFVVILLELSTHTIEAATRTKIIGEKILTTFRQPYHLGTREQFTTASIGAALFSDPHASIDELMKQADIAMYQAKKAGRNTMRFFDPQMQTSIAARVSMEDELHKALEKKQFQLHYQIQVDSSQRHIGAEVLIRWLHPEHGLISPAQFIPLAEETGLILTIGQWVLESACDQLKAWEKNESTRELLLAVNISAKQFRQADFVSQVRAALHRNIINPGLLKLELTESLLLDNIEDTIATMNTLKEIGVRFSLDDFGTGYSSLQYLKRLPLDQLKIDQSFVRDIASDSNDKAIVRTIIAMAQALDMGVIAEGVETEEQRLFLLNTGCTQFQGFLFGKPVPIELFEVSLQRS